jgi:hypothetical protein
VDATGGVASIAIAHAQLGDIALEVELSNGSVRVIASTATEHSAQVLIAGQAVLAERLAKQGFVLAGLDVVVAEGQAGAQATRKRARERTAHSSHSSQKER